jgi:hypothetical protein
MLAGATAGAVLAEDRFFVLRDGTKVPLTRSRSELGIVFKSVEDAEIGRQWLEEQGAGIVEDIEGAPHARVKILRVVSGGDVLPSQVPPHDTIEDVQPVYRFSGSDSPVVTTGTIVVKVRSDIASGQVQDLWADYGIGEVEAFAGLHDVYLVKPTQSGADEVLLAEQIAGDWRTLWANPDLRVALKANQVIPADKYFNFQWHLHNTAQLKGKDDADIDALEAWSIADGEGVLFGMFDQCADVDHEDLSGNYIGVGQDPALSSWAPGYDDPRCKNSWDMHGTAVMGLAVASANSVGVRGVSYRARFTASRGLSDYVTTSGDASTYTFALEQKVDVHINSWGYWGGIPPIVEEAIETAFKEGRDPDGKDGPEPPRGMVIVFSMGNGASELTRGDDVSTLPYVLGVGASTDEDKRADYSDYGVDLDFMAPSGGGVAYIATTDNEDGGVAEGYNVGGFNVFRGAPDIDPTGSYTGMFGGTSASCPIAAGVAGLILSVNKNLTATDVRIVMEHTCDLIAPDDAQYNGITGKSLKYGYGRINAEKAVKAAQTTLTNGNLTWPDVPSEVRIDGSTLKWKPGVGTDEFLVVESLADFSFYPEDGTCYDRTQRGCESAVLGVRPVVADVVYTGCSEQCKPENEQAVEIVPPPVGSKVFGIYGRNTVTGRYSFGGMAELMAVQVPRVTISATPLAGLSPLTVRFNGNAVSELAIDPDRTVWDFDTNDGVIVDSTTPSAAYTYMAPPGETRTYTARLTMYDVQGNVGSSQILIHVTGPGTGIGTADIMDSDVRIIVSVPGTPGSNVSSGTSPFSVELSVDATRISGTLQSVNWDLGDGTRATSLVVPHTYVNESDLPLGVAVTATVTTVTSSGTTLMTTATRLITVEPGEPEAERLEPDLPGTQVYGGGGGSATACGSLGMVPLVFILSMLSAMWLRRRSRCE